MRFRVVCGFGETIETLRPTSVFTSVDLPAFGRPTIATNPDLKAMTQELYAKPRGREVILRIARSKQRTRRRSRGHRRRALSSSWISEASQLSRASLRSNFASCEDPNATQTQPNE